MRQPGSGRGTRLKRVFNGNYFTLYVEFSSTKKQGLRLAFGARAGPSTVRNKAKRQARETFRLNRHRMPGGIEILITTKKDVSALSRRDIRGQILDLLERARKLSPPGFPKAVRADDTSEHC